MSNKIKVAIQVELRLAKQSYEAGDLGQSIQFLERAHVLGQRYFMAHLITHLWMLKISLLRRNHRETVGQLLRIVATVPGYLFGWVPVGNTGGANVSAIRPMPIPIDLRRHFENYSVQREIFKRGVAILLLVGVFLGGIFINHAIEVAAVERVWKSEPIVKVADFGATRTLEVTPLVNWHTASPNFKTEAGVSYLIKTDKHVILFDVGWNALNEDESPLLHNMRMLGVRPSDVDMIFLSHAHRDHLGGQRWVDQNSFSLGNNRVDLSGKIAFAPIQLSYPNLPVKLISKPMQISDALASTGPISRKLFMGRKFFTGTIEEQALVINVEGKGLVVIVGCGHQTVPKLIQRMKDSFNQPIHGLIGDIHYPQPEGRISASGLDLQKRFASGEGFFTPITTEQIKNESDLLDKLNVKLLAVGGHDSSDEVIDSLAKQFGSRYQRVLVGKSIVVH
jgi:7,8-dihydropterin-6-yl-methyl-4-(beta-D-ribofuranosyl)aminobenzene 5'-phosphate synthase